MLIEDHLNKISEKGKVNYSRQASSNRNSFIFKLAHNLYQPYKWIIFIPFLALSTIFLFPFAFLVAVFVSPKACSRIVAVLWSRINSLATPMLVTVEGKKFIDNTQSYVITSNHQSHYDIFVLYGWLGIDFKWVMKITLRKVPIIGYVCEIMEHIFIDRSNTKAALASINEAKKRITNGTSVLFFPEGTRSATGELGVFKKGAFKLAVDLGLPILPITIIGTKNILPTKTLDLFPGRARMIIHPPIDTKSYNTNNIKELMEETREIINESLPIY